MALRSLPRRNYTTSTRKRRRSSTVAKKNDEIFEKLSLKVGEIKNETYGPVFETPMRKILSRNYAPQLCDSLLERSELSKNADKHLQNRAATPDLRYIDYSWDTPSVFGINSLSELRYDSLDDLHVKHIEAVYHDTKQFSLAAVDDSDTVGDIKVDSPRAINTMTIAKRHPSQTVRAYINVKHLFTHSSFEIIALLIDGCHWMSIQLHNLIPPFPFNTILYATKSNVVCSKSQP